MKKLIHIVFLSLTLFCLSAIKVNALNITPYYTDGVAFSNTSDGFWRSTTFFTTKIDGTKYNAIDLPLDSTTNITGVKLKLSNDFSNYNGINTEIKGSAISNRLAISKIVINPDNENIICDLKYNTNLIVNGQQTDIQNKKFADFVCKGRIESNTLTFNYYFNQSSGQWTNSMFVGLTNLDVSWSDKQIMNNIDKDIKDNNDFMKDTTITGEHEINATFDEIKGSLDVDNDFLLELLMVPYNFLRTIVNTNSNECRAVNFGALFGTSLVFPCINWGSFVGESLYTIIDILISGCISMAFLGKLKMIFDKILTLRSDAVNAMDIKIMR